MDLLLGDIKYALRQFRQSPIFTLTATLTLALGIGGTTAIFSLIHAVMLRSLPVADPQSLYRIGDGNDCCVEGGPQDNWGMFTFSLYKQLVEAAPEFEEVAAFQSYPGSYGVLRPHIDSSARAMSAEYVTGNYFSTFGLKPFAGRLLTPADDSLSSAPVTVLSYQAWKGTYAGDPAILGSNVMIEGKPFTVAGIAPPGFFGDTLRGNPPDFWLPLQQEPLFTGKDSLLRQTIPAWLRVIGRVRPGANLAGMSERLTGVLRRWMKDDAGYPAAWMPEITRQLPKQHITVVPGGGGVQAMKEDYGRSLQILLAVCGLVLLIACANVANLLLARGMARRSQTSIRVAIGASNSRIISQSLAEAILLAIGGGVAGLVVAFGADRLLMALAFHEGAAPISATPSMPVLGFAFALSLVTGVLFGVGPAWFATRANPVEALRGSNRSTRDGASFSRRALLVTQATLSVVLVAGATMLARSLSNMEHQSFGINTKNRVLIAMNQPPSSYAPDRLQAMYRRLQEGLEGIPGVQQAGLAMYNPFTDNWGELIFVAGGAAPSLDGKSVSSWDRISANYFQTVGQSIVRGQNFSPSGTSSAPVAIINQAFAKRFFPNIDPLDKQFGLDMPENARTFRVIGIVSDAKYTDPQNEVRPMFYVPLSQYEAYENPLMKQLESRSHYISGAMLVTSLPPGTLEPQIRKVFAEIDPNLTVSKVRMLQEQVDLFFDQQRAVAGLAGLFGIVALILASVGLYGVTAYSVAQRTNEIGLRMALGADRPGVVRLVLRGAFNMVLLGLAIGIPLSIGAGRLISSQLYGIKIWDPVALSIAIGSLGICALFAAMAPAVRAAAIDPMNALRTE